MELLVVIAILALLGGLSAPGLLKSYRSSSLTQAGNRVVDIAAFARSAALSRSAMTAVVMVTGASSDLSSVANKALAVIQLVPGQSGWTQIAPWVFLPAQAKVYPNQAALVPADLPQPAALPSLRIGGSSGRPVTVAPSDYVCYVFSPDGTVYNASAPLPQAYVQYATDPAPSRTGQSAALRNYYNVVFSDAGGIHVVRP